MPHDEERFPWTNEELASHVLEGALHIAKTPAFAHHQAKASVERWLAFELAFRLDSVLVPSGWVCIVERGGTKGLGNIDLLIVPMKVTKATKGSCYLELGAANWPAGAIAIELKAAHLAQGESGYRQALSEDLAAKPEKFRQAGRPCRWFGLLITTEGVWPGQAEKNRTQTASRLQQLLAKELRHDPPLTCIKREVCKDLTYQEWTGTVVFEVYSCA
jgi:hypothetical protein